MADASPTIEFAMAQVYGASGTESAYAASGVTFVLTRTGSLADASSVNYAVLGSGGDPDQRANAADFVGGVLPGGVLTFAPGEATKTITIGIANDAIAERDENFIVMLSNPVNATLTGFVGLATILNDDTGPPPAGAIVSLSPAWFDGTEALLSGGRQFVVSRTGDTTGSSSVAWAVTGTGGSPANAADFAGGVLPSGVLTFAAGETSKTILVVGSNDTTVEPDESFALTISNPVNATLGNTSTTSIIRNDDFSSPPTINLGTTLTSGLEGGAGVDFIVNRTGAVGGASTVNYAVAGSGASPAGGSDFLGGVLPSGTISFAAGETTKTIHIGFANDTTAEPDETFSFVLSSPTGATLGGATGTGTILNDDLASVSIVSITTAGLNATEARFGAGVDFVVTRSGALAAASTVSWSVAGSGTSPASAADFVGGALPVGALVFAPGETTKTIHLDLVDDKLIEKDETFTLTIASQSNANVEVASVVNTIRDDDTLPAPVVSIASPGYDGTETALSGGMDFVVTRTGSLAAASTVFWEVWGSGAAPTDVADFKNAILPSGYLVFAPGESSKTIHIDIANDAFAEADESFALNIAGATNATTGTGRVVNIVRNDDSTPAPTPPTIFDRTAPSLVSVTLPTVVDIANGEVPLVFTARAEDGGSGVMWVSLAFDRAISSYNRAGERQVGSVVLLENQLDSFVDGVSSQTLLLKTDAYVGDYKIYEVTVRDIAGNTRVYKASDLGLLSFTVVNSAPPPTISWSTVAMAGIESKYPLYRLTRTGPLDGASSVEVAITGTGASPADARDFTDLAGRTVVFAPGQDTAYFALGLDFDNQMEPNESFTLTLTNPTWATLGTATATGTIWADTLTSSSILVLSTQGFDSAEASLGKGLDFVVYRTGSVTGQASANWSIQGSGGAPANGADFAGGVLPSGVVTFAPGQDTATIHIDIVDDGLVEQDETFTFTLSNPTGVTIGASASVTTIRNDDGGSTLPVVSLVPSNWSLAEGSSPGAPNYIEFSVQRTGGLGVASSVAYTVAGAGPNPVNGEDFVGGALPSGVVTFAAGEGAKTVRIPIAGDTRLESNEQFTITLSAPQAASLGTPAGFGTILDDDAGATSTFSIGPASGSGPEAVLASRGVDYVVTRTGDTTSQASVAFSVAGSGNSNLQANADDFQYGVFPKGVLTFAPGETAKTIHIGIADDTRVEPTEGFTVTLSNASGAGIAVATATGEIVDDEANVPFFINIFGGERSGYEGDVARTGMDFVVDRTRAEGGATVYWGVTASGTTRVDGSDFVGGSLPMGVLTFAPGEVRKTIHLDIADDAQVEGDETFSVYLFDNIGGYVRTSVGTGKILNDDGPGGSTIQLVGYTFGGSLDENSPYSFEMTFVRTGGLGVAATVDYSVVPEGVYPVNGADFVGGVLPSGRVSFAPGETEKTIRFSPQGDTVYEPNERFTVRLSNPTNATLGPAVVNGMIKNDDPLPSGLPRLQLTGYTSTVEGNSGLTPVNLWVSRDGDLSQASSVTYTVMGFGPFAATASDFAGGVMPTGVLNFAPGANGATLTLNIAGDTAIENWESYYVELTNPVNAVIGAVDNIGRIDSDDAEPAPLSAFTLSTLPMVVMERDSGSQELYFQVLRTGPLTTKASVSYAFVPRGAAPGDANDLSVRHLPSGTLTFDEGVASWGILIDLSGDTLVEPDESFALVLSNPVGALINNDTQVVIVLNDDIATVAPAATLSLSWIPFDGKEGNSGSTPFTFTVTRGGDTGGAVYVSYAVTGGTFGATASDFVGGVLPGGVIAFAPGETVKSFTISVAGDTLAETDEAFVVTLANPIGASLSSATMTRYIVNDDGPVAPQADSLPTAYRNILRAEPTGAEAAWLAALSGQVGAGTTTLAQAVAQVVAKADATTSVATLAYEFFTGAIPSQAGLDYLVSTSGGNANSLNSAYYQAFSLENRYINFAVNLGKLGAGRASFEAQYGAKDLFEATKAAYAAIFGSAASDAKVHALIDTRIDYFAAYGGDGANGIGTKAAMVGWLLAEAAKGDIGTYARSNDAFLTDLADGAAFAVDIVGVYGRAEYAYTG
jgi:hypothetical protein